MFAGGVGEAAGKIAPDSIAETYWQVSRNTTRTLQIQTTPRRGVWQKSQKVTVTSPKESDPLFWSNTDPLPLLRSGSLLLLGIVGPVAARSAGL